MSDLQLDLDLEPLRALGKDLEAFETELTRSVQLLAGQTHLKIIQLAQERLHSRREIYIKALAKPTEVSPGVWMITLDKSGVWIEEGMPNHSMVKDLLGDNPKTAADGSRYRVIPFSHSKGGPASQTPAEQAIVGAIKTELKKLRIPWAGVERNPDGSPKSGTLHKMNLDAPLRPPGTEAGPEGNQRGWGHSAVGKPLTGPTGIPFLHGLKIMQNPLFDKDGKPKMDSKGKQMASRSVMTFRVVSSKHESEGRWMYPGIEGVLLMDRAMEWCEKEWDSKILPELCKKLGAT